jgi:hypothetical protein
MPFSRIVLSFSLALTLAPLAWCQSDVQLFPMADLEPGLKGVGRTIFQGDQIEEFQVEILGVLTNVLAPKHDLILARLSGGPLEKTGIIAGMSGSPVYIDGKLVGAVAVSFPFSKEPLAGITPIVHNASRLFFGWLLTHDSRRTSAVGEGQKGGSWEEHLE